MVNIALCASQEVPAVCLIYSAVSVILLLLVNSLPFPCGGSRKFVFYVCASVSIL